MSAFDPAGPGPRHTSSVSERADQQTTRRAEAKRLDEVIALAFAPMDKLAFGIAVGSASGLLFFAATAVRLWRGPAESTHMALLGQFFAGYTESWEGAVIGLLWGFAVGAIAGWFAAFVRNFVLATWLLVVRARADLAASRDFLDHI